MLGNLTILSLQTIYISNDERMIGFIYKHGLVRS